MKFKIYTPHSTNRFLYALDLVFRQVGEMDFEVVSDKKDLSPSDKVINYSGSRIENAFQIHPNGLLNEMNIQKFDVPFDYRSDGYLITIFPTEFDDLGFDILSASFFLASRFEEYWKFEEDKHGRFSPKLSISSKLGFLKRPIINIWVKTFKKQLAAYFNINLETTRKFKIVNTLDIDNAWAHKHKGALRTIGAFGKAVTKLDSKDGNARFKSIIGKQQDPYDTYQWLKEQQDKYSFESIYFFLLGDYNKYDTNISHTNKHLQDLIKEISTYAKVGIHPSYDSFLNAEKTDKEITRLAKITNKDVSLSRKHFLRLRIPDCYQILSDAGIKDDYTMGYAQEVGFRAGLCTSFTFFDVLQNTELPITIHPFAYMDGTLNEYLKLSIEEAKQLIERLRKDVEAVNGTFMGIWHNDTLGDINHWKGWRDVYLSSFMKTNNS